MSAEFLDWVARLNGGTPIKIGKNRRSRWCEEMSFVLDMLS